MTITNPIKSSADLTKDEQTILLKALQGVRTNLVKKLTHEQQIRLSDYAERELRDMMMEEMERSNWTNWDAAARLLNLRSNVKSIIMRQTK
jgi:hypothetical protein